jgi:hypothetical protein
MFDTEEKKYSIKVYIDQDLEKAILMIQSQCKANLSDAEMKQALKIKLWKKIQ